MTLLTVFLILLSGAFLPVLAEHVICRNRLIDVGGNWIGARDRR